MGSWLDNEPSGTVSWGISGQVSPVNARELFALISDQLIIIAKEGITDAELQEAKDARMGGLQMGTETVRSLANWYGTEYYDNSRIDYVDDMPELITGTTVKEIQKLAGEFLESDAWAFGGIGNSEEAEFIAHYDALATKLNKG
jgi:predicted Zn-dependent peptidase